LFEVDKFELFVVWLLEVVCIELEPWLLEFNIDWVWLFDVGDVTLTVLELFVGTIEFTLLVTELLLELVDVIDPFITPVIDLVGQNCLI